MPFGCRSQPRRPGRGHFALPSRTSAATDRATCFIHRIACFGFQTGPPHKEDVLTTGTEDYYRERAPEYDQVYTKLERQEDLQAIRGWLPDVLRGRRVLDVASGTGYWTDVFAEHAAFVLATDVNDTTLEVARDRREWPSHVEFATADAFHLGRVLTISMRPLLASSGRIYRWPVSTPSSAVCLVVWTTIQSSYSWTTDTSKEATIQSSVSTIRATRFNEGHCKVESSGRS